MTFIVPLAVDGALLRRVALPSALATSCGRCCAGCCTCCVLIARRSCNDLVLL